MITCPWCGTTHLTFQSNCNNCGGPMQAADGRVAAADPDEDLRMPPEAPRPIPNRYAWRLLSRDGWAIAALVFGLLGVIFSLVGSALTLAILTAFIGIPFLLVGIAFLVGGIGLLIWRYQIAMNVVHVLREGQATRGQIIENQEILSVVVNGRHPWVIRYQFNVDGQENEGKVTVLNQPGGQYQTGKTVCVLYLATAPKWNSIYPHP
jgi:hypothetical protein